ncbi:cell division protein ZapB [bacterium]|nr:cell division protein ZapB [bacterium]MBU1613711.1 cell division protein ZapB [bacterium]
MVVRQLEILSEKIGDLLSETERLKKKNEELSLSGNEPEIQALREENKALKQDRQIVREKIKDILDRLELENKEIF